MIWLPDRPGARLPSPAKYTVRDLIRAAGRDSAEARTLMAIIHLFAERIKHTRFGQDLGFNGSAEGLEMLLDAGWMKLSMTADGFQVALLVWQARAGRYALLQEGKEASR
ncbi:hypothetical protein ES705_12977 [subsurface metagenome]